jgi:hypothetical protein
MKLTNFEITSLIVLESDGLIWDVHNVFHFEELVLRCEDNSALMRWSAPFSGIPFGDETRDAAGMELLFGDLKFLQIGPRDAELPLKEDRCVASVIKVESKSVEPNPWFRTRKIWGDSDEFRVFFDFQSARTIEIESATVELCPLKKNKN